MQCPIIANKIVDRIQGTTMSSPWFNNYCKIDTLHKQIEKNDTALATTLNEFPTVDEVNEALDELKNNMVNMDYLYTKEEADNKYSTKSMIY